MGQTMPCLVGKHVINTYQQRMISKREAVISGGFVFRALPYRQQGYHLNTMHRSYRNSWNDNIDEKDTATLGYVQNLLCLQRVWNNIDDTI